MSNLFKGEHGMIDEKKLVSLWLLDEEKLNRISLSEEELEEISEGLDVEVEHFYLDPEGGIQPFCYWDGLFYFRFVSLDKDFLFENMGPKEFDFSIAKQFLTMQEHFYTLVDEEKWEEAIGFSDKKVSFLVYKKLRGNLSEKEQKEVFLSVYQRNEYGFDRLDLNMVQEVLRFPTPEKYDIKGYKGSPDKDGYFTVYRGVTEKSSPLEKAYSWTLNEHTAEFFATRFDSNGDILKARVHKDNIRAYLSGRGESEVLIFPEDIALLD